jgi:hypothetical protein
VTRAWAAVLLLISARAGAAAPEGRRCVESSTIPDIMRSLTRQEVVLDNNSMVELNVNLVLYHVCRAVAAARPEVCDDPDLRDYRYHTHQGRDRAAECRQEFLHTRWVKSLITGGAGTARECRAHLEDADRPLPAQEIPGLCAMIAADYGHPEKLCYKLDKRFPGLFERSRCLDSFGSYAGDVSVARKLEPFDIDRALFGAYAAFSQRQRSGQPASCARSALCRAMSGEDPRVCDVYGADVKKVYCISGKRSGT